MGYTHYWNLHEVVDENTWKRVCDTARLIFNQASAMGVDVQWEDDIDSPPEASMNKIRFNGVGEDGHETFYLSPDESGWGFCKTARKPYDIVVVAILSMLDEYLGDKFEWRSDGDNEDHLTGKRLYQSVIHPQQRSVA